VTRSFLLATALLWPLPSAAQEVVGTISGTLEGRPAQWFVTSSAEGGQSDWSGDETYALVTILGHRAANTVLETEGALVLSFEILSESGGYNVLGRDISYYRQQDRVYMSEVEAAEIRVTSAVFDEGLLTIEGEFAGTLGATEDFGQVVNMEDSRKVSGTFQTSLLILE
jgi:hypothetical protein